MKSHDSSLLIRYFSYPYLILKGCSVLTMFQQYPKQPTLLHQNILKFSPLFSESILDSSFRNPLGWLPGIGIQFNIKNSSLFKPEPWRCDENIPFCTKYSNFYEGKKSPLHFLAVSLRQWKKAGEEEGLLFGHWLSCFCDWIMKII